MGVPAIQLVPAPSAEPTSDPEARRRAQARERRARERRARERRARERRRQAARRRERAVGGGRIRRRAITGAKPVIADPGLSCPADEVAYAVCGVWVRASLAACLITSAVACGCET